MIGIMIAGDKVIEMSEIKPDFTLFDRNQIMHAMMLSESKLLAIKSVSDEDQSALFKVIRKDEPQFTELVMKVLQSSRRTDLRCIIYDDDGRLLYDIDDKCAALM